MMRSMEKPGRTERGNMTDRAQQGLIELFGDRKRRGVKLYGYGSLKKPWFLFRKEILTPLEMRTRTGKLAYREGNRWELALGTFLLYEDLCHSFSVSRKDSDRVYAPRLLMVRYVAWLRRQHWLDCSHDKLYSGQPPRDCSVFRRFLSEEAEVNNDGHCPCTGRRAVYSQ